MLPRGLPLVILSGQTFRAASDLFAAVNNN
jgi:hypothetical protein